MARAVQVPPPQELTLATFQRIVLALNAQIAALQSQIDALKAAAAIIMLCVLLAGRAVAQTDTPTPSPTLTPTDTPSPSPSITATSAPCATFHLNLSDPTTNPPNQAYVKDLVRRLRMPQFSSACGGSGGGGSSSCSCGGTCLVTTGCVGGQTLVGGTAAGDGLLLKSTTNLTPGPIAIEDATLTAFRISAFGVPSLFLGTDIDPFGTFFPPSIFPLVIGGVFPAAIFAGYGGGSGAIFGITGQGTSAAPAPSNDNDGILQFAGNATDLNSVPQEAVRMDLRVHTAYAGYVSGKFTVSLTGDLGATGLGAINATTVNDDPQITIGGNGLSGQQATLFIEGSIGLHRTAVNDADLTIADSDLTIGLVGYTALSTGRTVSLAPSNTAHEGRLLIVKDEVGGAAASNITLTPHGTDKIDGVTSAVINTNFGSIRLYADGNGNWFTF